MLEISLEIISAACGRDGGSLGEGHVSGHRGNNFRIYFGGRDGRIWIVYGKCRKKRGIKLAHLIFA